MTQKESGGHDTLWLWDGEDEYEGHLGASDEHHLAARVRLVRRWTLASGAPGRPVPLNLLERQRALSRRICFAQSPALHLGVLLEFRVAAVQPCRDRRFDLVLCGTFVPVAEQHLDVLSRLSPPDALRYIQPSGLSEGSAAVS